MTRTVKIYIGLLLIGIPLTGKATVDEISGDSGSAQNGSVTISGGTSGLAFDSTTSTITGSLNFISMPSTSATEGKVVIAGETVLHTYSAGNQNIFVGSDAGNISTTGAENTAVGASALNSIGAGIQNTALGDAALISLTDGSANIGIGEASLGALLTGNSNIAIGTSAGSAYTSDEHHNIILGNNGGIAGEINTIRIGDGQVQVSCYIDGINTATVDTDTGVMVFVDANGKLGTIVSSEKYKEHVRDIDTNKVLKLRPVSFYFKDDATKTKQYGLIAEEVYKVFPELVVKDKRGKPNSVRYHELAILLLDELQRMDERLKKLERAHQAHKD